MIKIISDIARRPRFVSEVEWEANKDTVYRHWRRADANDIKVITLSERTLKEIQDIKKKVESKKKTK